MVLSPHSGEPVRVASSDLRKLCAWRRVIGRPKFASIFDGCEPLRTPNADDGRAGTAQPDGECDAMAAPLALEAHPNVTLAPICARVDEDSPVASYADRAETAARILGELEWLFSDPASGEVCELPQLTLRERDLSSPEPEQTGVRDGDTSGELVPSFGSKAVNSVVTPPAGILSSEFDGLLSKGDFSGDDIKSSVPVPKRDREGVPASELYRTGWDSPRLAPHSGSYCGSSASDANRSSCPVDSILCARRTKGEVGAEALDVDARDMRRDRGAVLISG